jgi:UDP-N-acetylglucosamine 3-dehydrogenase
VGIFPPHPLPEPNVIMGLVIHDLDILDYLLDGQQPLEVFANGEKFLTKQGEDSAEVFLSYKGISVFIQTNWITPGKIRTISITGLKGYAELNCLSQELEISRVKKQTKISNFRRDMKLNQLTKEKIKINTAEPLFCEMESFVECVRNNKKFLTTGRNGLKALMLVEKTLESLKNNKVIKI